LIVFSETNSRLAISLFETPLARKIKQPLDKGPIKRQRNLPAAAIHLAFEFLAQHLQHLATFIKKAAHIAAGRCEFQRSAEAPLSVVARSHSVLQLGIQQIQLDLAKWAASPASKLCLEEFLGQARVPAMDRYPNPSQRLPLEIFGKLKPFCGGRRLMRHGCRDRLSALTIAGQQRAPRAFPT
jgi:hypothetical protein